MPDLKNAGVLASDDVPEESLLGTLVGVVHHGFTLEQKKMESILKKAKLPKDYWPNKPKAIPSFQAACRSLESPKRQEITFKDPATQLDIKFIVEYMIDVLPDGSRQLTRKINYPESAETSKELQKILDIYVKTTQKEPEKMAKFQYDKITDTLTRKNLYKNENELDIGKMSDEMYERLLEEFNHIRKCYTERYLKDAWSKKLLRVNGGIPWLKKCGSLWFVPKEAKELVEAFGRVYKEIHGEEGTWRTVPIVDTKQHRDYLKDDVMEEYKERFKGFLENIGERIESDMDPIKQKELIKKSKDDFEEKMNKEFVEHYNKLLGMSISAKVKDFSLNVESSRAKKAMEMLRDL